jgi:hypothetical protein
MSDLFDWIDSTGICNLMSDEADEYKTALKDRITHYTPKTEQPQRIKYRCPSCSRQELVLHDGWLFCGNLECKSPDAMDALIEPKPSKENPNVR